MGKIRLGYVGCGFMAQKVHIPNFRAIPDCELVALAEVRTDLGRQVQARFAPRSRTPAPMCGSSRRSTALTSCSEAFSPARKMTRDE